MDLIKGRLKSSGKFNEYMNYGKKILDQVGEFVPPNSAIHQAYFSFNPSETFGSRATDYGGDDVAAILSDLRRSGRLFEDPNFPADDSSLFTSRKLSRRIEWRRPHEIARNPEFFVGGASRFDVKQGELGDCWLLAAVSNLTIHPYLFNRVVPSHQTFRNQYTGMFFFRFWRFGKWIEVAVDDRLPTIQGKLAFLHSSEVNEFWSALFEKAYAKLHGSYEALTGGRPSIAMDDFTGGVSEIFELKRSYPKNLFDIMLKAYERGSLIACSIEPNPNVVQERCANGLVKGHAYSITSVKYCHVRARYSSDAVPLVRIRNPWGDGTEWNGPWSDKSREWRSVSEAEKQSLGLTFDRDGEFWMAFEDFVRNFSSLEMTNVNLESLHEKDLNNYVKHRWEVKVFEGSWIRGVTAGGCANNQKTFWNNPQYSVTLREEDDGDRDMKCTMIVALLQKPKKAVNASGKPSLLSIGFAIYPMDKSSLRNNREIPGLPAYVNHRQISHRYTLPPGTYCIIPSTFAQGEEATFLMRVFTEKPNHIQENDTTVGFSQPNFKNDVSWRNEVQGNVQSGYPRVDTTYPRVDTTYPRVDSTYPRVDTTFNLVEAFRTFAGSDGEMDSRELQKFLNQKFTAQKFEDGFSRDACRSMVAMLDLDKSGKLGLEEFQHLWNIINIWKVAFENHDKDLSGYMDGFEFRNALMASGFNVSNGLLSSLLKMYGDRNGHVRLDDFILCSIRMSKAMRAFAEKDVTKANVASFTLEEFLEQTMRS